MMKTQSVTTRGFCWFSTGDLAMTTLRIARTLMCAGVVFAGVYLQAQTPTATILGKVTDPSGATVPGALVHFENASTALKREGRTTSDGDYTIPSLPVGTYTLSVTAQGFKTFSQSGIILGVGQNARVDARLEIGSSIEKVEVTGRGLQVDTQSSALRTEVDNTQIGELPLNTRDVLQLVTLVPGVGTATEGVGASTSSLPTISTNQRVAPVLNVNGSRDSGSDITLDGTVLAASLTNWGANLPNPDSISEFQMLTSNYDAEHGRASGAVFVAVSKSGTNKFHGATWEYLRNDALNATNFFAPPPAPKPILKQNQFGAAFGGPIIKDKTFFYFTYEGLRIRQVSLQTFGALTAAERNGDFSALSTQLTDPSTGLPYPNNKIPSSEFDPMAVNYTKDYLPIANPTTGLVNAQYPQPTTGNQFTIKGDHRISASDLVSARFFRMNNTNDNEFAGNIAVHGAAFGNLTQGISVRETHIFRSNLLADFGFSDTEITTHGAKENNAQTPEQLGASYVQDGSDIQTPDIIVAGGFTDFPLNPWLERSGLEQFDASVSWIKGHHQVRFGIQGLHQSQRIAVPLISSGEFVFGGGETGNALADFLIGRPVFFAQKSYYANLERTMGYGIFAQDNYKVGPRLTLNLGLRYELMTPWNENGGMMTNIIFDTSYQSKRIPTAAPGFAFPGDPGVPAGIYPMDKTDFAPRLGFSYDVFGDGKTAVRGGYGMFYNPPGSALPANEAESEPFIASVSFFPYSFSNPYGTSTSPFPWTFNPNNPQFSYPTPGFSLSPDLKNSFINQYSLNVQHQFPGDLLVQVGYIGSHGSRLWRSNEANSAPWVPGATAANAQSRRPFENQYLSTIGLVTSDAYSNYNSLQVSARKRFAKTYSMQLAYTYSKSLDDASDGNFSPSAQNPEDVTRAEYGLSTFDQRHLFRVNGVWDLPRLNNWGPVRHAVGGWELSGILDYSSGVPFSVTTGTPAAWLASSWVGNLRLNQVGNPCSGCGSRTQWTNPSVPGGYFDPTAFAAPADGQFGDTARDLLTGPSYFDTDMSFVKNFTPLKSEALRIQLRADFFNLFNTVSFNNPVNTIGSTNFGKVTSAAPAREIQVALRFDF
jgi:hypothetical protein